MARNKVCQWVNSLPSDYFNPEQGHNSAIAVKGNQKSRHYVEIVTNRSSVLRCRWIRRGRRDYRERRLRRRRNAGWSSNWCWSTDCSPRRRPPLSRGPPGRWSRRQCRSCRAGRPRSRPIVADAWTVSSPIDSSVARNVRQNSFSCDHCIHRAHKSCRLERYQNNAQ